MLVQFLKNLYISLLIKLHGIRQAVAFPIVVDKKTKKTAFRATATSRDMELLRKAKLGLMRIIEMSGKWYAQISIEVPTSVTNNENIMGIDLGLKVPAVSVTSTGKTRFQKRQRKQVYTKKVPTTQT
ncbi:hypothetical protein P7H06_18525 [Paenibacillus larvae]|nr:hypothetical protein [Paenibacillus larvae]MDT2261094.1 hypothetical protein [Paenibacillus larvae]